MKRCYAHRRKAQGCGGKDSGDGGHGHNSKRVSVTCIISIPPPLFKRGGDIPCNKAEKQSSGLEFGLSPPFWGLLFDTSTLAAETGKSQGFALRKAQFAAQNFLKYLHSQ